MCRGLGGQKIGGAGVAWRGSLLALALLLLAPWGCGGQRNFSTGADELRRRNHELFEQVRGLERDIEQYIEEVQMLQRRMEDKRGGIEGADPPQLSQVRFGRYSGALDINGDGDDDLIRLYVLTLDQHGRFLPVAAIATVRAVRNEIDQDPQVVVERQYGPEEFDKRYRSGFTGTHYTLDIKLPSPVPEGFDEADVSLFIKDMATDITRRYTQTIAIQTASVIAAS